MGQLGSFFASLKASGVRLSIITKGNVGACRYLLEHEGLLQHFEQVFGMLGQFYGESDFDRANPEPSSLEGSSDCELRESKANLIRSLMSRESLAVEGACLVEDDAQEIASVQGICRSVFVAERRGMTESEMNDLRRLAGLLPAELMAKTGTSRENAAAESPVTLPPKAVAARASASEASKPKATPAPAPDKPAKPISAVAIPDPSLAGTSAKVQHIYFDFDQTISRIHVFKQLAGWEPGVRPPHALSERGQIHRLKMLNEAGPVFVYDGHAVQVAQTSSTTASWTACALGGCCSCAQIPAQTPTHKHVQCSRIQHPMCVT